MKSGFWRRASLAGLVYAAIFIGFVFLQYSSASGLSWRSGIVDVHGTPASAKVSASSACNLSIAGMRLLVDGKHPAQALLGDGSRSSLALRTIARTDGGVALRFGTGVSLDIEVDGQSVSIAVSSDDPSIKYLELPVQVPPPSSWIKGEASSEIAALGRNWSVSLPASAFSGSGVDLAVGTPVRVAVIPPAESEKAAYAVKSDIEFRQTILAWLDETWAGLSGSRFDSTSFKWKMADGTSSFSEQALAAWLAESLRRGQGEASLAEARQASAAFSKSITWMTVPYFGDTVARMAELESEDASAAKDFEAKAVAKDPTILEAPDLFERLVDRSPRSVYDDVIGYLATLDPATLTSAQRIGLLAAGASASSLLRGSSDPLPNHVGAEALVLSDMVRADGAWFLKSSADGKVDIASSLDGGLALISLGKVEGKDNLLAAGQALVDGALSLGDASGFLPSGIVAVSGSIVSKSGSLAPESLYGELADNPWYPHEVSFAKDLEPGVWAWTCSPVLTVDATSGKRIFSATFPAGDTHFLVLYGIGTFSNIKLYGIDYSPDPQFESYNVSGYFYRGSIGALYLKMRHKSEVEKIELDN